MGGGHGGRWLGADGGECLEENQGDCPEKNLLTKHESSCRELPVKWQFVRSDIILFRSDSHTIWPFLELGLRSHYHDMFASGCFSGSELADDFHSASAHDGAGYTTLR